MTTVRQRSPREYVRGFTLVELLIVVAMIGVLAALAVVGYRKYLNTAHSAEAKAVLQGIRNAQETYKAETLTYLNCSADYAAYYPQTDGVLSDKKWHWVQDAHSDYQDWRQLNVVTDGPVRYGFAVVAGAPGAAPPSNTDFATPPVWPASPAEPWYVVQATGDLDKDGVKSVFVSSSFSGQIFEENESE